MTPAWKMKASQTVTPNRVFRLGRIIIREIGTGRFKLPVRAVPPLRAREGRGTRGTMGLWDGVKFLVREAITYKTVKVRRRPGRSPVSLPAKTESSPSLRPLNHRADHHEPSSLTPHVPPPSPPPPSSSRSWSRRTIRLSSCFTCSSCRASRRTPSTPSSCRTRT